MSGIESAIVDALGLYGNYAVRSLVEDYEYYAEQADETPDVRAFLSSLTLVDDGRTLRLEGPGITLSWNDSKKRWDGFKQIAPKKSEITPPGMLHPDFSEDKLESNLRMLSMFPGSEQGLRALFSGPGFTYDGQKINFRTYLGIVDVVLDTFEGQRSVSIDDPEGSYIWDPLDGSWSNLD